MHLNKSIFMITCSFAAISFETPAQFSKFGTDVACTAGMKKITVQATIDIAPIPVGQTDSGDLIFGCPLLEHYPKRVAKFFPGTPFVFGIAPPTEAVCFSGNVLSGTIDIDGDVYTLNYGRTESAQYFGPRQAVYGDGIFLYGTAPDAEPIQSGVAVTAGEIAWTNASGSELRLALYLKDAFTVGTFSGLDIEEFTVVGAELKVENKPRETLFATGTLMGEGIFLVEPLDLTGAICAKR